MKEKNYVDFNGYRIFYLPTGEYKIITLDKIKADLFRETPDYLQSIDYLENIKRR